MSHATRFLLLGLFATGLTAICSRELRGAPPNPFRANDEFIVASRHAPLMRGDSTLATLNQGQRLKVLKVEGPWVGTAVTRNGQKIGGWVWAGQAATPQQYAALRRSVRRYSYSPTPSYSYGGSYGGGGMRGVRPNQESPRRLIMGATPYGPSYWRADRKIIGY